MARSRGGEHRHRKVWREAECPVCHQLVPALPVGPGRPLHLRVHFTTNDDDELVTCAGVVAEVASPH